MNFDLSDDELMLKALAERFVEDRYDRESRLEYLSGANGFSESNWSLLAEIGLTAAFFAEDAGGMGIDDCAVSVLFQALGRGLVIEPLIDNVLLSGSLFAMSADEGVKARWLERLLTGEARLALAHFESAGRGNSCHVRTTATSIDGGYSLAGDKSLVAGGAGVDGYLVSARPPDGAELSLFMVGPDTPGLSVQHVRTIDGALSVALRLDGAVVDENKRLEMSPDDLADALARADLARSSETLGIMDAMFEETGNFLREREQFGSPLSQFQALQHRMVAQYAIIEQARALLDLAVMADSGDRNERLRRIAGARAFIGENSVAFGHEMIQMHGAMGVSDELWIGAAHKRLFWNSRYPAHYERALDTYASLNC